MEGHIQALLSGRTPQEVTEIASRLSLEDAKQLLKVLEADAKGIKERFPDILKALPEEVFSYFSTTLYFHQNASSEIIQNKIQECLNQFKALFGEFQKERTVLQECITELPLYPVSAPILASLCDQIIQLADRIEAIEAKINQMLPLIWLTQRSELVALASELKSNYSHLKQKQDVLPVDLIHHLNSIYGAKDAESSMEGLSALGIQYIEDLKQLSCVLGEEANDIPEKNLPAAIHDRLVLRGLSTVADLKKQKIFTKDHLFAYLKKGH